MRKITRPIIDDVKVFDAITNAKRNPRRRHLTSIRAAILAAYNEYIAAAPDVDALASLEMPTDKKEALMHCFDVETAPLRSARGQILGSVTAARCPFCGLSESSTIDHYLPKEDHPQFAVFSANLVPCCASCNARKRTLVVDESTSVRLFIHPYFDNVPDRRFLRLDVSCGPSAIGLRYRVVRPSGLPKPLFSQLTSHFRLLGLGDRYRIMSLDDLRGRYRALDQLYGSSQDATGVAAALRNDADSLAGEYGVNHWRSVLYETLAANSEFCDGGFKAMAAVN